VARFHDGYSVADLNAVTTINMRCLFYPKWWLKIAGYWSKFDPAFDYEPTGHPYPDHIDEPPENSQAPAAAAVMDSSDSLSLNTTDASTDWMTYLFFTFIAGSLGYLIGAARAKSAAASSSSSSSSEEGIALTKQTNKAKPQVTYSPNGSIRAPSYQQEV